MGIAPLDDDLWFAALGRLQQRLSTANEFGLEQLLRHAFHLQQLTPLRLRAFVRARLDEAEYENLLESGDYELAADALVGPPLSCIVRSHEGNFLEAAVHLPGHSAAAIVSRSTSRPQAMLGAWLLCLRTFHDVTNLEQLEQAAVRARSGHLQAGTCDD